MKNGLIEIENGGRIDDAIKAAGGITNEADLSRVNLAYKLEDGQKVYIPSINDENEDKIIILENEDSIIKSNTNNTIVNINTATQTELETLRGIGPSTAMEIINYRKENGRFKNCEEIMDVPGIGEAKYEAIKNSICVK